MWIVHSDVNYCKTFLIQFVYVQVMLYCLTISLFFHKMYAHSTWIPWSDIPTVLFSLSLTSWFSPVSEVFYRSLYTFAHFFSFFFLVCLLSIFLQIFIVILYNPVYSCIYCTSHLVGRHVLCDYSVKWQDAYLPVCMHLGFFQLW